MSDSPSDDDRIHPKFRKAITGRISSSEPVIQNIPIRTELGRKVRDAFLPKKDTVYVDPSYVALELRLYAQVLEEKARRSSRESRTASDDD